jgi:hypothetical protein
MGLILGMLLAAAIDFGRAYYTALIVENMAGEGAAYAAKWPMNDIVSQTCSGAGVLPNQNIQDRARRVAADRGLIIRQPGQADIAVDPPLCSNRCPGLPIKVTVTYRINDLFLPSLLGMRNITIKKSATQWIEAPASRDACAAP